jgi:hypothetical protein
MARDDLYRNPNATLPAPAPSNMPVTEWATPSLPLTWTGVVGGVDTATWRSPIFDLHPDIRSAQGDKKQGVPVWNSYYAHLYVQVSGLLRTNTNTERLSLYYREYANTTWGTVISPQPVPAGIPLQAPYQAVVNVSAWVDITGELMQGIAQPDSVVLVFEPIGSGYPVRYWMVELRFVKRGGVAGGNMNLQGALY